MSAVAFALPSSFVAPPAITEAARTGGAAEWWRFALDRPNSVTVDSIRADRLSALVKVCGAASVRGWDGDDAEPVTAATFRLAKAFLDAVPSTTRSPEVSAHFDGDVEFEWFRSADRVLTISVGPSGIIHYAALVGARPPINGREVFAGTIPAPVAEVLAEVALSTP
jgi:hypothetical protein